MAVQMDPQGIRGSIVRSGWVRVEDVLGKYEAFCLVVYVQYEIALTS